VAQAFSLWSLISQTQVERFSHSRNYLFPPSQDIRALFTVVSNMGKNLLALAFLPALLAGQPAPAPAASFSPLDVGDKFEYRLGETFGITKIITVGVRAGYDQLTDTPSEWKQGGTAYAKRYVSEFGITVARQTFAFTLESVLHEDPRYFPSGQKGFFARTKSALKQTVITRTDSGRNRFATAKVGSALAAPFLANKWQPPSTSDASTALSTFAITLAGDAGYNFLQEFFPRFRPKELR
jgi:hypothetical protein